MSQATTQEAAQAYLACLDADVERAEALASELRHRRDLIGQAMGEEVPSVDGAVATSTEPAADKPPEVHRSISAGRLNLVRDYFEHHEQARQADITKDLNLNSGAVSVALKLLRDEGVVKPGTQENGSRVWERVRVLARH
jgi:hypothetical protein